MIYFLNRKKLPKFTYYGKDMIWSENFSKIVRYTGKNHTWTGDIVQDACFIALRETELAIGKVTSDTKLYGDDFIRVIR